MIYRKFNTNLQVEARLRAVTKEQIHSSMLRGIIINGKLLGEDNEDLQTWAGWLPEQGQVSPATRGMAEANHRDRAAELQEIRPFFKLEQTKDEKEQVEEARLAKKAKAQQKVDLDALKRTPQVKACTSRKRWIGSRRRQQVRYWHTQMEDMIRQRRTRQNVRGGGQ